MLERILPSVPGVFFFFIWIGGNCIADPIYQPKISVPWYFSFRHADEAHDLTPETLAQLEMRIFELEMAYKKVILNLEARQLMSPRWNLLFCIFRLVHSRIASRAQHDGSPLPKIKIFRSPKTENCLTTYFPSSSASPSTSCSSFHHRWNSISTGVHKRFALSSDLMRYRLLERQLRQNYSVPVRPSHQEELCDPMLRTLAFLQYINENGGPIMMQPSSRDQALLLNNLLLSRDNGSEVTETMENGAPRKMSPPMGGRIKEGTLTRQNSVNSFSSFFTERRLSEQLRRPILE